MQILDSGNRRQFESGAVRDIAEGKGRTDLLPLKVVADLLHSDVLFNIECYIRTGSVDFLHMAIVQFVDKDSNWPDIHTAIIEVSKQYEQGCQKYGDRNWEKGIPVHCYIDSGVRHYLKFKRGDTDEPHDRAFVWNMLGAIWTHENKPELIDLPFAEVKNNA
jgi:hypothetical protein